MADATRSFRDERRRDTYNICDRSILHAFGDFGFEDRKRRSVAVLVERFRRVARFGGQVYESAGYAGGDGGEIR